VIRLNPSTGPARLELAAAYAATGDSDLAIWILEQAFPDQPESSGAAANNIAWNLSRTEPTRGDAALALARYASSKLPRRAEPWDTLGSIYLARGDIAGAVTAFEKSAKLAPGNPTYRARLEEARRRTP
jgi:Flp pilus assembly protein TadD